MGKMKTEQLKKLIKQIFEFNDTEALKLLEELILLRQWLEDDVDGIYSMLVDIGYDSDMVYELLSELGWL